MHTYNPSTWKTGEGRWSIWTRKQDSISKQRRLWQEKAPGGKPREPQGERREPTPEGCPLTSSRCLLYTPTPRINKWIQAVLCPALVWWQVSVYKHKLNKCLKRQSAYSIMFRKMASYCRIFFLPETDSCYADLTGLRLTEICRSLPPICWDWRCTPPTTSLFFFQFRDSHTKGEGSATELSSQPCRIILWGPTGSST